MRKNKDLHNVHLAALVFLAAVSTFGILFLVTFLLIDKIIMPLTIHSATKVIVPDVKSLSIHKAEDTLRKLNLVPVIVNSYYSDTYPAGTVISQIPYPNSEVKENRKVYLTVSKGRYTPEMPYLVGLELNEAKAALLKLGVSIDSLQYIQQDSLQETVVVEQNIPPGQKLTGQDTIILIVNAPLPRRKTVVPNVIGLKKIEAEKLLTYQDLRIGLIRYQPDNTFLPGTVIDQFPKAGDSVLLYTPVSLTISTK